MKKIVVVGNGMVSFKFCEKFLALPNKDEYSLQVFGEEPGPAYDRVHLSGYFSGKSKQDLELAPGSWYKDHGIDLHTSSLVSYLEPETKEVVTHKKERFPYDYLVLATGSSAFIPPIKGADKQGVFVYRTLEDLDAINQFAVKLKKRKKIRATILGGGLLGLEAANAARELGLKTQVVEFAPKLMPRQLDDRGSTILVRLIEELGIKIHTGKATSEILGNQEIEALKFSDGSMLPTELLIISAGIRPRDELAGSGGLKLGKGGGFLVNNKMETSVKEVFAIGEAASYNNAVYGLVAPGFKMAEVALSRITGGRKIMEEHIDMSTQLKLIGTDVASFGDPFLENDQVNAICYENKRSGIYKRINVGRDGKKLYGGILVGDASDYQQLFQIYSNGMPLPEHPEELILGSRGQEGSSLGSVMELPDSAQICSCEAITKGAICEAMENGKCDSLEELIQQTKASTGCGGCKPMVTDLYQAVQRAQGKEVKVVLCEHFGFNRQELYDLIKINKVRDFQEALRLFGKGSGCEKCKPALASIFAGLTMETPNKQLAIQDSNDRFLANIQRNGTYSVVPRIPGGEITPEKLMVLGAVAKKYDLYTKITGGQRIDMFGVQLHQLPLIWKELIDAGFESGHAYGKSLRTVKSCVGSTWCRYGMHESVSFAIAIEERYRGLRAPHKLKGGVSGCIRECAEARGKDFGIIAVESGWNLYVCGNGGATPKHAILLAEGLDDKTCVTYLDRFLMYYIRTAPPLTRTAPWLEKLDGGVEHLKKVIIEDSLGLAEELEKEMQGLINRYECEWKQAIEDPDILKRYRHFTNSEEGDDNIQFVSLREQKMPKAWK